MPRFFVDQNNIADELIKITGEDVNHIKRVLRLRSGDALTVCDGRCTDYEAIIEHFESDYVIARIISSTPNRNEAPLDITLFQGLPKSDKMDLIIQKGVELGVKKIVPVITERAVVRINNGKDALIKVARWQRIALEAAKQCNRGIIPQIGMPVEYKEALRLSRESALSMIPYEKETGNGIKAQLRTPSGSVAVFIGPEGGFTEDEVKRAIMEQVRPVSLGPRILRTETAAIAVLSILMYELGDLGGQGS